MYNDNELIPHKENMKAVDIVKKSVLFMDEILNVEPGYDINYGSVEQEVK